jgi:serine/threonine protein phosphatase PrpC
LSHSSMDLALSGGAETTIVLASVVGHTAIIASAGDSVAVHVPLEGPARILTETSKSRLGSREVHPFVCQMKLAARDVLVLAPDGLYAPLGLAGFDRVVRGATTRNVTDVPQLLLDPAAHRGGLADDATAVVLRYEGSQ